MDFFKDLVWDTVLEALLNAVLPGWLSAILGPVFRGFADKLYASLRLIVDMENIRIKNNELRLEYNAASVQLKLIAESSGPDSEAFKNARLKNKQALKALVNFAPPAT